MDFSVIKELLCEWLETNWDHKFLVYVKDPLVDPLVQHDPEGTVIVDFNPTAENMGKYLVEVVGPQELPEGVELVKVVLEETRKCSVEVTAQ